MEKNEIKCDNTVPYRGKVNRKNREQLLRQQSVVLWFTGLSGSGKSTIAHAVEELLYAKGKLTYVFDGDNVRHGLCGDLDFSPGNRAENLRRVSEMVKLFFDPVIVCLAAFISPLRADRERCKNLINCSSFYEIHVKCPLEVCEQRDTKGLYKKAREGKIKNYTGVSAPYEEPIKPDLVLETNNVSLADCVAQVIEFLDNACTQKDPLE